MRSNKVYLNQAQRLLRLLGVKISKQTLALIVILAVSLVIYFQSKSDSVTLRADYYPVEQVFDGDTIEVNMAGNLEKVRFIGIDTPETHHPEISEQCYGKEATNRTKELLEGKKVRLVADELSTNRDIYERLLRYVYDEEGRLVNGLLIEEGYAFATSSFRYSLKDIFVAKEYAAQKAGVGLWSACKITYDNGRARTNPVAGEIPF